MSRFGVNMINVIIWQTVNQIFIIIYQQGTIFNLSFLVSILF